MSRFKAVFLHGPEVVMRSMAHGFRRAKLRSIPEGPAKIRYVPVTSELMRAQSYRETSPKRIRAEHAAVLSQEKLVRSQKDFGLEWNKPTALALFLVRLEKVILKDNPKLNAILFKLPRYLIALHRLTLASREGDDIASMNLGNRRDVERRDRRLAKHDLVFPRVLEDSIRAGRELREAWNGNQRVST